MINVLNREMRCCNHPTLTLVYDSDVLHKNPLTMLCGTHKSSDALFKISGPSLKPLDIFF